MNYRIKSTISLLFTSLIILSMMLCVAADPNSENVIDLPVDEENNQNYKELYEISQNESTYYKELYENQSTNVSIQYITEITNQLNVANENIVNIENKVYHLTLGIAFTASLTLVELGYIFMTNRDKKNDS